MSATNPNVPTFTVALDMSTCAVIGAEIARHLSTQLTYDTSPIDRWLTTSEAADYLGVSKSYLHRQTAARAIPFEQETPGGKCYFRRAALDAWRAS